MPREERRERVKKEVEGWVEEMGSEKAIAVCTLLAIWDPLLGRR